MLANLYHLISKHKKERWTITNLHRSHKSCISEIEYKPSFYIIPKYYFFTQRTL